MTLFLTALFSGISFGLTYSLVAVGLLLVFLACGAVNLAQGELITLGMYGVYIASTSLHLPYWLDVPIMLLLGAGAGIVMERIGYRPFVRKGNSPSATLFTVFIATLAISTAIQGILGAASSNSGAAVPVVYPQFNLTPASGVVITASELIAGCVSLVALAAVFAFLQYTQLGRAIRATAQNADGTSLMGANPHYFAALAWCLSGALGALAGVLLASGTVITPTTGSPYLFLAFAAAVLGGFGSVPGAVVGALILGLGESMFGAYVNLEWTAAVPFVLLILVLLLRPSGLFGSTVNRV